MASNVTTVTHADGTISKRTSKTMVYTHAVEVSPARADGYAADLERMATKHEKRALKLDRAAEDAQVTIRDRGFSHVTADSMNSHVATLAGSKTADGQSVYTWCNADGMTRDYSGDDWRTERPAVAVGPYLVAIARDQAASDRAAAIKLREEAAKVRATGRPIGEYGVVRWSTRADLAEKYAASVRDYWTGTGATVRVVAVDA